RRAVRTPGEHVSIAGTGDYATGNAWAGARGKPSRGGTQAGSERRVKALVTGANGFLGVHVASALLARGHEVRALIRPAANSDDLIVRGITDTVRADLRSSRDLEKAFEGVDVLVHLAAAVTGGEDAQFASTVVGTERLLGAMARTSCRRIVLASSFSV